MIDILKLERGHKVFELGAGSGWNAALMGHIVGHTGKVVSLEVISDLITPAKAAVDKLGLSNVSILHGDGGDGYEDYGPYDRAVFTAGSFDLPQTFYKQIKNGGLLLFVLKNKGGADTLVLLEKKEGHFESTFSMPCGFVPVTGKYRINDFDSKPLETVLKSAGIDNKPTSTFPFYWGGAMEDHFSWSTTGLRSFLSVSEPHLEIIEEEKGKMLFGILDRKSKSFVLAKYNQLVCYGSQVAKERLINSMKNWFELGMPALSNLKLKAYPSNFAVDTDSKSWISKRKESTFVWSLPRP